MEVSLLDCEYHVILGGARLTFSQPSSRCRRHSIPDVPNQDQRCEPRVNLSLSLRTHLVARPHQFGATVVKSTTAPLAWSSLSMPSSRVPTTLPHSFSWRRRLAIPQHHLLPPRPHPLRHHPEATITLLLSYRLAEPLCSWGFLRD